MLVLTKKFNIGLLQYLDSGALCEFVQTLMIVHS